MLRKQMRRERFGKTANEADEIIIDILAATGGGLGGVDPSAGYYEGQYDVEDLDRAAGLDLYKNDDKTRGWYIEWWESYPPDNHHPWAEVHVGVRVYR